jgi:hypothetical protein
MSFVGSSFITQNTHSNVYPHPRPIVVFDVNFKPSYSKTLDRLLPQTLWFQSICLEHYEKDCP